MYKHKTDGAVITLMIIHSSAPPEDSLIRVCLSNYKAVFKAVMLAGGTWKTS